MDKHQIWKTALSRLQDGIYSSVFTTWFSNTVALSFHEGIFVVGVQTTFAKAHLEMRYLDVIRITLTEIVGPPLEIQLVVADDKLLAGEMFPIPIKPPFRETSRRKFLIVITQEESCHRASVPDVPECVAVGKTREEAVHAVGDALHASLAMMQKDHMALPEPRTTAEYLLFPPSFCLTKICLCSTSKGRSWVCQPHHVSVQPYLLSLAMVPQWAFHPAWLVAHHITPGVLHTNHSFRSNGFSPNVSERDPF